MDVSRIFRALFIIALLASSMPATQAVPEGQPFLTGLHSSMERLTSYITERLPRSTFDRAALAAMSVYGTALFGRFCLEI